MATGDGDFKIATGYVEIVAKVDDSEAERAGEEAGQKVGDGVTRGKDGRLRDAKGKFLPKEVVQALEPEGNTAGQTTGRGFLSGLRGWFTKFLPGEGNRGGKRAGTSFTQSMEGVFTGAKGFLSAFTHGITFGLKGFGDLESSLDSNPYIGGFALALGGTIAVLAAPVIGAGITAAFGLLAGGGVLAAGIALVSGDPKVKAAGNALKNQLLDMDTTDLEAKVTSAQDKLNKARASGSKKAIAEAKGELASAQADLNSALTFNAKNFSLKDAAQPLVQPVIQALGTLQDGVAKIMPQIGQSFQIVAPFLQPLVDGFVGLVTNALPGFNKFLASTGPLFAQLGQWLPIIGQALGVFFKDLAGGSKGSEGFMSDLLRSIVGVILVTGKVLEGLSIAYDYIRRFFKDIPGWASEAWSAIEGWGKAVGSFFSDLGSTIASWATTFAGWFVTAWNAVGSFFSSLDSAVAGGISSIGSFFSSVGDAIVSGFSAAVSWLEALPGEIIGFLESLPSMLLSWAQNLWSGALFAFGYGIGLVVAGTLELPGKVMSAVSGLWDAMSGAFMSAWNSAVSVTTSLVDSVGAWLRSLPGKAADAVSSLWSSMVGAWNTAHSEAVSITNRLVDEVGAFLRSLPGKAAAAVSSLWGSISGAFSSARSEATSSASQLVEGFISFMRQLPGRAAGAVSGAAGAIRGAFAGAGSWLVGAGEDIIRGVGQGIKNMISWAVGQAKSAAGQIVSGFKSALGISSPSKVMAKEVGQYLPPGIVKGYEAAMPAAQMKINAMAADIPVSTASALGSEASPSPQAGAGGWTIQNLIIKGVWDFTDPVAVKKMIAMLYDLLSRYEKGYA